MRPGHRNTPAHRASGVTSVEEARLALGSRLRELRRKAKLTGKQLAESLSWPASKISKLENGRQTPTEDDIRAWTESTNTENEAGALLASLHTLETRHAEWTRQLHGGGLRSIQTKVIEDEQKVRLFRIFESTLLPGILQTAEYARARFEESSRKFEAATDVDEAVRLRLQRQEMLYQPNRRFHFVLTEAVLRYRLCPPEAMLAQLDRLVSLSALRNVRLGIIDFSKQYSISPLHGFWLRDSDRVNVETFSAELRLAQPEEIELYSLMFDQLAAVASYGSAARAIIQRVIDDLSGEVEEPTDFE